MKSPGSLLLTFHRIVDFSFCYMDGKTKQEDRELLARILRCFKAFDLFSQGWLLLTSSTAIRMFLFFSYLRWLEEVSNPIRLS